MANKVSRAGEYLIIAGLNLNQMPIDLTGDQNLRKVYGNGATLDSLTLTDCTAITEIYLNSLVSLTSFAFGGCAALQLIELDGFTLNGLTIPDLPALTDFALSNSANLTTLTMGASPLLLNLTAQSNALLTSFGIGGCTGVTSLYLDGCALTEGAVDAILAALDTNGLSNGEVDLSGGTNAIPSAAGLASKASLEGKGWTVTVNS